MARKNDSSVVIKNMLFAQSSCVNKNHIKEIQSAIGILSWTPDTTFPLNRVVFVKGDSDKCVSIYEINILSSLICLSDLYGECNIEKDIDTILKYITESIKSMGKITYLIANTIDFKLFVYSRVSTGYDGNLKKATENTKLGKNLIRKLFEYQINIRFDPSFNLIKNTNLFQVTDKPSSGISPFETGTTTSTAKPFVFDGGTSFSSNDESKKSSFGGGTSFGDSKTSFGSFGSDSKKSSFGGDTSFGDSKTWFSSFGGGTSFGGSGGSLTSPFNSFGGSEGSLKTSSPFGSFGGGGAFGGSNTFKKKSSWQF